MTGLVASNSELLAGFGDTVQGGNEKFQKNLAHINRAGNNSMAIPNLQYWTYTRRNRRSYDANTAYGYDGRI